MAGIVKTIIRVGVVGGLVVGAAVLIAGPPRAAAVADQLKHKFTSVIDNVIDDPIAMRAQLRNLEAEYPKRISEVRSHLTELEQQMREIEREKAVSDRVVALAQADLYEMSDLLARAEDARTEGAAIVRVSFDETTYNLDAAYRRASEIRQTVDIYTARTSDYTQDIDNLNADAVQLNGLLNKLESEHAQFQTQLAHLERQIDAVARKERMVDVMRDRQKTLDELSDYRVASLDQFKGKLAKRTAELDAQLASLSHRSQQTSYEDRANFEIDRATSNTLLMDRLITPEQPESTEIIEIRPESDNANDQQVASRTRVIR